MLVVASLAGEVQAQDPDRGLHPHVCFLESPFEDLSPNRYWRESFGCPRRQVLHPFFNPPLNLLCPLLQSVETI